MTDIKLGPGGAHDAPPVVREVNYEQEPNGEVAGSLLSQLREAAKLQQQEHINDIVVGGEFKKQLWIRYKPLDGPPMDRFITRRAELRDKIGNDPRSSIPFTELNMDLMAQACVAVVGANQDGENKQALEDDLGPVRLEHRLAVLLGFPVPTAQGEKLSAREVIMLLFANNAMAIIDHGEELLGWMRDPSLKLDQGKS